MDFSYIKYVATQLKEITAGFEPKVALVLGSGFGGVADSMDLVAKVSYDRIEGFASSTVNGHNGQFLFGYLGGVPIAVMDGRVHLYEGYPVEQVVLPIRVMYLLGAKTVFLTNAAGGVSYNLKQGDLMAINDHISNFVPNPLIGANMDELGLRFPDMSQVYDRKLTDLLEKTAASINIDMKEGVYVQLTGPSYETPAEVRMLRNLGGDAVGMSTVCEAIAARHCGMRVVALSFISNMACGMTLIPLSHKEVQEMGRKMAPKITELIKAFVPLLKE